MSILCIGRATFDLGYACPSYPQEDGKLSADQFWAGAGGSALNGAITARALGSEVKLLGLFGAGPFADAVRSELARYDVPFEDYADPAAQVLPVSSIVLVPAHGTRTITDQQPPQEVTRSLPDPLDLTGVSLVYCDGFLPELAIPYAKAARERGIPVVLDGGSWKPWTGDLIAHVDHAVISERFHPHGANEDTGTDVLDAVQRLGPSHAVITRGPKPLEWSHDGKRGKIAPPVIEAVDTLGAGDIFHGAYCHYLAEGRSFTDALEQASHIAAASCRHFGTRAWIEAL